MSELNILPLSLGATQSYKTSAIEKIRKEDEKQPTGQLEKALRSVLVKKLVDFIDQSEEIAEVVFKTPRTIDDCCYYIGKEVEKKKNGSMAMLSDIEVYTMLLRFYFPSATIRSTISLDFGERPTDEEIAKPFERPAPKASKDKGAKKPQKSSKKPAKDSEDEEEKRKLLEMEKAKEEEIKKGYEEINHDESIKELVNTPTPAAEPFPDKPENLIPIETSPNTTPEQHGRLVSLNDLPPLEEAVEEVEVSESAFVEEIPEEEVKTYIPCFCEECGDEEYALILEYNFGKYKRHLCHRCADKEVEKKIRKKKTKAEDGIIDLDLMSGQMGLF